MADLKTNLLGFVMNSPVIGASGTVGYGVEYEELADFAKIGGISGKGLTLHGQYGNKGERLWETPSGLINSIGLQNPGVQHFIDVELPEMLELKQKYGTVAIANLGGHSEEEYVEGAAMLSESAVDIVELNISCPNVKVGGMAYGVKAEAAGEVVRMVRAACKKPLMVKLSPQAENIPEMCKAVEAAGADAISLTNTFQACAIDLAGPEGLHHIDYYKDIFEKANELGVPITIHSDHKFGPVTIWESIKLGARRIGHGFDAIDDGMLTSFLANTGIPLELCPTSEVTYGPFDSYAQFTLKRLLDAGVKVTINTDDPTVFGCDLKGEYSIMEKTFGLTKDEVKKIMHNAVDAAFLDADQQAYLRELVDERLR